MFDPLQTERLILRKLTIEDAAAIYAYRSEPSVSKFQNWKPKTSDENSKFVDQLSQVIPNTPGTWLQLGIVVKDSNRLIGDLGIRFLEDDIYQTELGITLSPSYQNQGYALEVLHGIFDYIFVILKKHRVFASVDPDNLSAIALMKRAGMRQEAHHLESLLIGGIWVDDVIFAMLSREWLSRKK